MLELVKRFTNRYNIVIHLQKVGLNWSQFYEAAPHSAYGPNNSNHLLQTKSSYQMYA